MALPPNQARFVQEYLVDLNATAAAERAGYSKKTAYAQGSRLLRNAEVRSAIEAAQAARAQRVEVKADDVLRELFRIATVDIAEAFDSEGRLRPLQDIPLEVRKAISAVEVSQEFDGHGEERYHSGDLMKVKFWDKPKALELLGRHLKMFTDKIELKADGSFADLLKQRRERAQRR